MFAFTKSGKFGRAVKKALADKVITDDELAEIDRLQAELGLSEEKAKSVLRKQVLPLANKLTGRVLDRVKKTRRYSPDDEEEIRDICRQLKVTPDFDQVSLQIYRKLWEVEATGRLEPEPVEADIRLGRNEICYHYCPSVWLQMKTVREHHGYAGGSIGFRVAKGVTLRFGRAVPITSTREELVEKAGGELYVTNKKLAFIGQRSSTNVTYGRLARWEIYSDGIEVIKNSGKPDVFRLSEADIEYVDALLQTV